MPRNGGVKRNTPRRNNATSRSWVSPGRDINSFPGFAYRDRRRGCRSRPRSELRKLPALSDQTARNLEGLTQGSYPARLQQVQQLYPDCRRGHGIAESGMAAGDDDAQPFRCRHQRMIDRVVAQIDGEQERIENRVAEPHTRLILLELQKTHVEGGIPGNEDTVADEILELRKHDPCRRLVPYHVFGDAVNAHARRWNRAARIDQALEGLA